MKINPESCPFKLDQRFIEILEEEISKADIPAGVAVVLSFRDESYSSESGGFMPVEVMVNASGEIQYLTDFCFCGGPYPELVKNCDFDFSLSLFQMLGRDFPIHEGAELFATYQSNFIEYHRMQVYTVTVEAQG